ncbi:MAG: TolC family protein [Desulfuromonadales bacterium]|nr:TolC family protein [Desulfuromonadales bacterium]MBN2792165.1 TolC family protein [Desulfuromonadales bacterium]
MFYPALRRAVVIICLLLGSPAFSHAELLTFDNVLAEGLKNALDLQIGAENLAAAEAAVGEARADYYPQLFLRYGQEYVHVYDEFNAVVSVGDTVYSDSTSKYKSSLYLFSQYNLYDFGRRRLKIDYAEQQVRISSLQIDQGRLEVSRMLLDLYSRGLKLQYRMAVQQAVLDRHNRIYRLADQLRGAGRYGRQDVGDAALALAETLSGLEDLRIEFAAILAEISLYTRREYNPDDVSLSGLELPGDEPRFGEHLEMFPEILILQEQIKRKKTELTLAERTFLPQLTLSGSFGMYGSDDNSYSAALQALSKRDASIYLSINMPLFDGFSARSQKRRLQREIAGLELEKQKTIMELQNEYRKVRMSYQSLLGFEPERDDVKRRIGRQTNDLNRLSHQQMIDQVALERKRIAFARHRLDADLRQIDYVSAALLLKLLNEAGS